MSRLIMLDAGPVGPLTRSPRVREAQQCSDWLGDCLAAGAQVIVPEIADYEVRRELLRLRANAALRRRDLLGERLEYVPLTTVAMRRAAELWAQMRQQGQPTADPHALDADVILAAQAQLAAGPDDLLTVATTNVGHLERLVPAQRWEEIV
jgi:predicted nucleic acid-binding protein